MWHFQNEKTVKQTLPKC